MCNCWCERWFPEPKCTCTLVGRCRCWLEFVAWWKTKLSPQVQICQRWLYSRIMILAMPTLEENIVLIQSSLFTLMIIVVCKLDYLMYIKYVNTGDSSLTAERSFFKSSLNINISLTGFRSIRQIWRIRASLET